jgi:tetratricopeptide (TPR) repeat protein
LERQKDTLVLLGSLALNDDQFEQSIQDFSKALQIANEFFADQYREIAFINMELARVQRKAKNYAEACAYFDKATQAIQEYKKKLESEQQTDGGKLIAEIDEILDDISGEKALVKHYETDKENASTSKPQSSVVEAKPIDSLLIKRKETRPVSDTEESAAKKTKMDN